MPYDATWPPDHAELDGAPFRDQFNALKALIDAQAVQIAALNTSLSNCVTTAAMTDAILATSANNCDFVTPLNPVVSNPPTQAQVLAIATKLNQLLAQLQHN